MLFNLFNTAIFVYATTFESNLSTREESNELAIIYSAVSTFIFSAIFYIISVFMNPGFIKPLPQF